MIYFGGFALILDKIGMVQQSFSSNLIFNN